MNIEEGVGPVLFKYGDLEDLLDIIKLNVNSVVRLSMTQEDADRVVADFTLNVPNFKYFSILSFSDYIEVEKGLEVTQNSAQRNEVKLILGDKSLEIDIYIHG